jgi:hypothetical protein
MRERFLAVGQGQQVVEIDVVVRRPGEMFGKAFRFITVAQTFETREMLAVEFGGCRSSGPPASLGNVKYSKSFIDCTLISARSFSSARSYWPSLF